MSKKIESIKHNKDKRAHIPSKEEAGYEEANPKVIKGKRIIELPKNPVVQRGQDPELFWLNKYGNDDRDELLKVDIRSLYRHEHIAPETLINGLYRLTEEKSYQGNMFNDLFGNALEKEELEKVSEYYKHQDGWTNRLIQGDSHLVMASLLEREGMAGQVQMVYFDPPYGIKYGSNWQIKLNSRNVIENDENLSGEPEQIKAFRDTWELGIHSYLTYLRDRLLIARELLTESGSCFIQISDENVHLVRNLMDEVFGSDNFISLIKFRKKTMPLGAKFLEEISDFIIYYAKDKEKLKYRQLYVPSSVEGDSHWNYYELPDGSRIKMTADEINNHKLLPKGADVIRFVAMHPIGFDKNRVFPIKLNGKTYLPPKGKSWKTDTEGIEILKKLKRIEPYKDGDTINYVLKLSDYPISPLSSLWADTSAPVGIKYVVETNVQVVKRCLLMSTDPGDLILDPTMGSGTTAYIAEQFGRRWITIDTSRIALSIAKQRLMTAVYPFYKLYDDLGSDIRQGFIYKNVPHITMGSITNSEPSSPEILYDLPEEDKKKLRVSGPFTIETLQNFEPNSISENEYITSVVEDSTGFEETIKQHLLSSGIKNGRKDEHVVFLRVESLSHSYLHAEGFYMNGTGEKKAYIYIGPKFGTVSKSSVNEAVKECRTRGDAQWLIILGFSFESDIEGSAHSTNMGKFEVTKARIHDDLLQEGLKKKPGKSAASFVTIGEPDIEIHKSGKSVTIEIQGLDIYDPIKDEVKARNVSDIAYWMVDDDYDGSNFIVKQVFFCGGDKDEFNKWKKGLENLAKDSTKKKVERTLKVEIDDEAFDRLYGHLSHPIEVKKKGQKIAVRVISQFGEETTKVLSV